MKLLPPKTAYKFDGGESLTIAVDVGVHGRWVQEDNLGCLQSESGNLALSQCLGGLSGSKC